MVSAQYATGEAQFERHRFLTGFCYVVFATLASQTVLAEKLKVFKKARRDASSPVQTELLREWKECYFNGKCALRHSETQLSILQQHGAQS